MFSAILSRSWMALPDRVGDLGDYQNLSLLLLAGILEFLQALDWPSTDFGLPVFPRAPAALFFCVTTAWSLGKQVLANERRKEQLRLVAQTRLDATRHTQHQVKNALAQIVRPLYNVLNNTPPEQQAANYQRTLRAVTALQELHHTLDVALNLARVEVGEPLNLGAKESVCIADFVEALCRRRLNLEETVFNPPSPRFPHLSLMLPGEALSLLTRPC